VLALPVTRQGATPALSSTKCGTLLSRALCRQSESRGASAWAQLRGLTALAARAQQASPSMLRVGAVRMRRQARQGRGGGRIEQGFFGFRRRLEKISLVMSSAATLPWRGRARDSCRPKRSASTPKNCHSNFTASCCSLRRISKNSLRRMTISRCLPSESTLADEADCDQRHLAEVVARVQRRQSAPLRSTLRARQHDVELLALVAFGDDRFAVSIIANVRHLQDSQDLAIVERAEERHARQDFALELQLLGARLVALRHIPDGDDDEVMLSLPPAVGSVVSDFAARQRPGCERRPSPSRSSSSTAHRPSEQSRNRSPAVRSRTKGSGSTCS